MAQPAVIRHARAPSRRVSRSSTVDHRDRIIEIIAASDLPQCYIALPDETTFVEAMCHSHIFRPESVFVPVSAGAASGLFEVEPATGQLTKRCSLADDGLWFGCKLGDDGVCYMLFVSKDPRSHAGKVYSCDLSVEAPEARVIVELPLPYQPNDIAIDSSRGRLLIAAYEQTFDQLSSRGQVLNKVQTAKRRSSKVFAVPTAVGRGGGSPEVFCTGLNALAGAVVSDKDNALWLSELHNLVRVPLDAPDKWARVSPFKSELLADHMELDGDELLFPFYRAIAKTETASCLSCLTSCLKSKPAAVAPIDAAEEKSAGPGEVFEDARWGRYNVKTKAFTATRLDIRNTNFNGHCTHMEKVGDEYIFVNYLKKELLVVATAPSSSS